ncbi:MAG: dihydrolipoamide acetyltransferase family protein [Phycisphaerales bacterium]
MAHAKAPANPNDFILPDLGEGVHEAELIAWRVQVGQEVAEHDILAEMETDKALVEVPSPRPGTIAALHGKPGEILHVGNPLVSYEPAGGSAGARPGGASAPKTENAAEAAGTNNGAAHDGGTSSEDEDAGTVVGQMSGAAAGVSAAPGKALATPAVRRLARDLGVDLGAVRGTGIGGRVTEKDVRAASGGGAGGGAGSRQHASAGRHSDVAPSEPEEPHSGAESLAVSPGVVARATQAPARPASRPSAPAPARSAPAPRPQAPAIPSGADSVRIPFRGVRRTIAARLRESVSQAVHFNVMDEADVTALDGLRRKLAAASGERVSFLPFVASAVCRVLTEAPFRAMNATVDERPGDANYDAAIVQHRAVHLGIATDTESGLMVPVIRDCDALGVLEVSRQIAETAAAARNRSIPREQLLGSTFTISNVGSHAGRFATPIINYPEVGILAVGRGRQAPVIRATAAGPAFAVGQLLPLSLACDHRVVDGATAALALARIIELLQNPESLLGPARG